MKTVILEDKFLQTGKSPVYNEKHDVIGFIQYHFFSFRGSIEILNHEEKLVSAGKSKILTFMPQWIIEDEHGMQRGVIKRKFSFFNKVYTYENNNGRRFQITGNFWDRKFSVVDENEKEVLNISTVSSFISLKPYTFSIEFKDELFDTFEAVSIVQGVRSLVKQEQARNRSNSSN
jgi:uncharacterized protein YxjI